ncbi:sugar phosphate isomerase/epimerase [bacterium]|nr:sugar phosphate isomerase/epimerase [bacterium]
MRYLICSRGEDSEREFIPELNSRGIGVELQGYGLMGVKSLGHWNRCYDQHRRFREEFEGYLAVHGPFIGINYCHDDYLMRDAVRIRLDMIYSVVKKLRAETLVLHSGLHSDVRKFGIYEEWIILTAKFWKEEVKRYADMGVKIVMENIVDDTPEFLRRVHDTVDHPNFKLCLDTGHVNVWSESGMDEWLAGLGNRISHIHVHNNDGLTDQHLGLDQGTLDLKTLMGRFAREIPEADISLEILGDAGYLMKVQSLVETLVR